MTYSELLPKPITPELGVSGLKSRLFLPFSMLFSSSFSCRRANVQEVDGNAKKRGPGRPEGKIWRGPERPRIGRPSSAQILPAPEVWRLDRSGPRCCS
jgi:hypothetical protein